MKSPVAVANRVTAGEVSRNFGQWQDAALSGPVIVTHHGRPRVVMISAELYAAAGLEGDRRGDDQALTHHDSETARAALVGHMSEGFVALDPDLRITAVNTVFEGLKGLSAAQMIGAAWGDLFSTPAQTLTSEQFRRVLRTGDTVEFEADSTVQPGRCYGVRAFPYPGGVAALFVNRTEERQLRQQLGRTNALEDAVIKLPGLAVARLNVRGVLSDIDHDFLRMTGFTENELRHCRLSDIVRPSQRRTLITAVEEVLQGGPSLCLPITLLVKDSTERPGQLSLAPLRPNGVADGVLALFLSA